MKWMNDCTQLFFKAGWTFKSDYEKLFHVYVVFFIFEGVNTSIHHLWKQLVNLRSGKSKKGREKRESGREMRNAFSERLFDFWGFIVLLGDLQSLWNNFFNLLVEPRQYYTWLVINVCLESSKRINWSG